MPDWLQGRTLERPRWHSRWNEDTKMPDLAFAVENVVAGADAAAPLLMLGVRITCADPSTTVQSVAAALPDSDRIHAPPLYPGRASALGRSVRRARPLEPHAARICYGRTPPPSCHRSPAARWWNCRFIARSTSTWRRLNIFTRLGMAKFRCRCNSAARSSTPPPTTACRSPRFPGTKRPIIVCRSRSGRK